MLLASGSTLSLWLPAIISSATLIVLAIAAYAAFYPHIQARKAETAAQAAHRARVVDTNDFVLGRKADRDYPGQEAIEGMRTTYPALLKDVARVKATLGDVNGSGRDIVQVLGDAKTGISRIEANTADVKAQLHQHLEADTQRFAAIEATVRDLGKG